MDQNCQQAQWNQAFNELIGQIYRHTAILSHTDFKKFVFEQAKAFLGFDSGEWCIDDDTHLFNLPVQKKIDGCDYRHYGIEHAYSAVMPANLSASTNTLSFYRSDKIRPFTELERQYCQWLSLHIIESFRLNLLGQGARGKGQGARGSNYLL